MHSDTYERSPSLELAKYHCSLGLFSSPSAIVLMACPTKPVPPVTKITHWSPIVVQLLRAKDQSHIVIIKLIKLLFETWTVKLLTLFLVSSMMQIDMITLCGYRSSYWMKTTEVRRMLGCLTWLYLCPTAATGTSEKIGNNARVHNNGFDRDA